MTEIYREAFAEVYEIIKYIDVNLKNKIPKNLIGSIKDNMSTSYKFQYDKMKKLKEQNIKRETRAILSVIYRDYICEENIKKEIIQKDKIELTEHEKKKKAEFKQTEIFTKKQIQNNKEEKAIQIIKKQNIIFKIIERIKELWRKKFG